MKVDETIDLQGYWWLPENEQLRLPGRIRVANDGGVSLELLGAFGTDPFHRSESFPILNGTLENGKRVTLSECVYKHSTVRMPGISTSELYANLALIGHHFASMEDIKFTKAYFHFEGLDKWLGLTGIRVSHGTDTWSATISFTPPEEIEYQITEDLKLRIGFSWSIPALYGNIESASVSQKAMLSLESPTQFTFEEITSLVYKINCFLCLGINEPSSLTALNLQRQDLSEPTGEIPRQSRIDAYYKSLPQSKTAPRQTPFGELFAYNHIRDEFPRYLAKWLQNYDRVQPAFDLYFASTTADLHFLESHFLFLVNGLETLHRRTIAGTDIDQSRFDGLVAALLTGTPADMRDWLSAKLRYANEPSLRKRLRSLSDCLGAILGEEY